MKHAILLVACLIAGCSGPSSAPGGALRTDSGSPLESKLIGMWSRTDGVKTYTLRFTSKHTYEQLAVGETNGEVLTVRSAGTWQLDGDTLTEKPDASDLSNTKVEELKKDPGKADALKESEKATTDPLRETSTLTIRFPDEHTLIVKSLDGTEDSYSNQP